MEDDEFQESIMNLIKTLEYIDYFRYEKKTKMVFEIDGILYESDILRDSLGKLDKYTWKKVVDHIGKLAEDDDEFSDFIEWRNASCEKCMTVVKGEKCSRYHPEWGKYNLANGEYNNSGEDYDPPSCVTLRTCPNCGYIDSCASGIDEDPEGGIK